MRDISPKDRAFSGTSRLMLYYRPSPDGTRMVFGGRAMHLDDRPAAYTADLHGQMLRIFPQLEGVKLSHGWSGTVAYTFDHVPHIGQRDGLHYAMGYCGSGVGWSTYYGRKAALKMLGSPDGATALDDLAFSTRPFYSGTPVPASRAAMACVHGPTHLIFPHDAGHRVKNHIMTMIQNAVIDEKGTQNIRSGIQERSSNIGDGTWLQLCSGRPQFRYSRQFNRSLEAPVG